MSRPLLRDRAVFERALAPLRRGVYATDGHRLYRVASELCWPEEGLTIDLEDCQTLYVREYGADELREMGLRVVRGPVSLAHGA